MTLCDTGPLVALIDGDDPHHGSCVEALKRLPASSLVTTWPCLVEAMYLLRRAGGLVAQEELWGFFDDGLARLHESMPAEQTRMRELMRKYEDTPMDLADASLVAAAETLGLRQIFTLDRDFYAYRIKGRTSFEIIS